MRIDRDARGLVVAALAVIFTLVAPGVLELFTIINLTTAIALAVLALSLALVWGYGEFYASTDRFRFGCLRIHHRSN